MKYSELLQIREQIRNSYFDRYQNKGFDIEAPLKADQKDDITLDYVTCTVCRAKKNIALDKIGNDYVMLQPAIRNTHITELGRINDYCIFLSCFTMMGGYKYLMSPERFEHDFNDIVLNEFEFLTQYFDKNVILTLPIQYEAYLPLLKKIKNHIISKGAEVKISTDDENNLKWKYGIKNVVAYGTRWEVFVDSDKIVNWGNTISVFKNGIPVGIDFGGGFETLIYANQNFSHLLYANEVATDVVVDFCINSSRKKIIDCLSSIVFMIGSKNEIILRDKYIVDKYFRLLISLSILEGVSKEEIVSLLNSIKYNVDYDYPNNIDIFSFLYDESYEGLRRLSESESIDGVVKLYEKCYNNFDDHRIKYGPYRNYFNNLSEVEILAIQKMKSCKRLEKRL